MNYRAAVIKISGTGKIREVDLWNRIETSEMSIHIIAY